VAREQDKDEPNRPFLRGCLLKFLVMLSQARQRALGVAGLGHMRPEVWRTLDGLERALEAGETVRVASLAAAQSLSPEHLTREFKRATGLSIMQYFQRRRMTRAARQLLHPEASATDVAYALGFSDYAHFRRRFKAHFGESPSNYRKARL
jgi:AraC-like DNA-binding protein